MSLSFDFFSGGSGGGVPYDTGFGSSNIDLSFLNQLIPSGGGSQPTYDGSTGDAGTPPDYNPGIDWTKLGAGAGGVTGLLKILNTIFGGGKSGAAGGNAASIQQLLSTLLGTGTGVYGAINNLQQQEWDNSGKVNVLNELRRLSSGAEGQASAVNGALLPQLVQAMQSGGAGQGNNQDITDRLKYLYNYLPARYDAPTTADAVPGLQGAFDYLGGAQGANNRGLQTAFSQLESGPNGLTQPAMQSALQALMSRGMTPEIQTLLQQAQGLMAPKSEVTTANKTAEGILSKAPLLPFDQAVNMAVSGAATDARNQFSTLQKQLLDRTGIQGPAIATGNLNDFLSQAGDTALQQVADARRKAISDQQGLQLQQFGAGSNLLGTAANAGQGYTQQGLQTMLQSLAQAQNRETTLPSVFGSLFGQDTNRLGTNYSGVTSLLNNANTLNQQRIDSVMGLQNFGLNKTNSLTQALSTLLGQQQGNANSQIGQGNAANSNMTDILKTWAQFMSNSGNSQANLFNTGNNIANPFQSFLK